MEVRSHLFHGPGAGPDGDSSDRGAGLRLRILRRVVYQLGQELDQHPAQQRRRGHRGPGHDLCHHLRRHRPGRGLHDGGHRRGYHGLYQPVSRRPAHRRRHYRRAGLRHWHRRRRDLRLPAGRHQRRIDRPQQAAGLHRHAGHDEDSAQRDPAGHADRGGQGAQRLPRHLQHQDRRRGHPAHPLLAGGGGDSAYRVALYALRPPCVRRGLQRAHRAPLRRERGARQGPHLCAHGRAGGRDRGHPGVAHRQHGLCQCRQRL